MTAQDAEHTGVSASPPTPHVNGQMEVWESVQWETHHVYDGDGLTVIGLDETPETNGGFFAGCIANSSGRWNALIGCAMSRSENQRGVSCIQGNNREEGLVTTSSWQAT